MPVEGKSRIGLVPLDDEIDGFAHGLECWVVEPTLGKDRCITRRNQKNVALADRDFELFGKMQDHFAARHGTPGLKEAQMPRRNIGFQRQIQLAEAASLAPASQMLAYVNLLN